MKKVIGPKGNISNARQLERFYITEKLVNIRNKTIVDYGCLDGTQKEGEIFGTPVFYGIDKSNTLIGIDIRDVEKLKDQYIVSDIISAPLSSQSVDIGICVSTIEHIGLTKYMNELDPKGDEKALQKMIDVLKIGGKLYVTFPCGAFKDYIIGGWIRVYSEKTIDKWVQSYPNCSFERNIFGLFGKSWYECTTKELAKIHTTPEIYGICCLNITKGDSYA